MTIEARFSRRHLLALVAVATFAAPPIAAHAADPMTTATGGKLSSSDRTFVTKAAIGNMTEIKLGELAEKNAQNQAVKDFGARMIKDHTKAQEDLVKAAAAENVTLPGEPDKSHQAEIDKMAKETGADFDKTYVNKAVSDHKADVADFKKETKSKNAGLQAYATETLPVVEEHLHIITDIKSSMK